MVHDRYRHKELRLTSVPQPDSPRGQDQQRTYEDGEKRWVITWSMKFEGGDIDLVKPVHVVFSDDEMFSFLLKA